MKKKCIIFLITILFVFILNGCAHPNLIQDLNTNQEISTFNIEERKQIFFSMGQEIKMISEIPGIDDTAILVNGNVITRKDIEKERIESKYSDSESFEMRINSLVREEVVIAEAVRLGIQPTQETIDMYVEQTKQVIDAETDTSTIIQAYINGMGITQEEYIEMAKKEKYKEEQRIMLWDMVRPEEAIKSKVGSEKEVSTGEIDKKYYEKYVDELMEKADIEILDPELKSFFPDGFLSSSK